MNGAENVEGGRVAQAEIGSGTGLGMVDVRKQEGDGSKRVGYWSALLNSGAMRGFPY